MIRGFAICALLLAWQPSLAVQSPAAVPAPEPQPFRGTLTASSELRDPQFNLEIRAPGLRREVEVWVAADDTAATSGAWASVDDKIADESALPLASRRWLAQEAAIAGRAVAADLLATLDDWQPLPVDSSILPENLAAVFAVVDGALFSGNDAAAPQPGDLRVRWSRLPAGPVFGAAYWRQDAWHAGDRAVLRFGQPEVEVLPGLSRGARPGADLLWWSVPLLLLALLTLVFRSRKRPCRGRHPGT